MLYISIDKNVLRLLQTKKTLLGQQEVKFFQKRFEIDLVEKGEVENIDILASAIKEAQTTLDITQDKDVFLILPQESFRFLGADVPADIAPSAIKSFVYDKVRSELTIDTDNYFCDYYVREIENKKHISFFALSYETLEKYFEALKLLNLRLVSAIPETLAIFKLFEKTLRSEKKENIFYVSYSKDKLSGYLFDTSGLVSEEKWEAPITKSKSAKDLLKEEVGRLKKKGTKLNRIILSGEESDKIRQDTFTKEVGAWTNPLKRIIPNFYEDYVKQLVLPGKESFPLLSLDVCFGAFVFSSENKEFQLLRKSLKSRQKSSFGGGGPKIAFGRRDIFIFLLSLIISFSALVAYFRFSEVKTFVSNVMPKPQAKPTPTPVEKKPTPTKAPEIKKDELRIKVQNGSGTAGKASEMKALLTEKGYQEVLTENADNFDYKVTVIQAKEDSEATVEQIKKDLGSAVESPKIETLDEEDTADIVIIVGSDFE